MRRFRPIMLTAAAAVLALIPLAARGLLGADGAGHDGRADCGDHLTLTFLPALYALVFRIDASGRKPAAEASLEHEASVLPAAA